jgi:hypothetical protein
VESPGHVCFAATATLILSFSRQGRRDAGLAFVVDFNFVRVGKACLSGFHALLDFASVGLRLLHRGETKPHEARLINTRASLPSALALRSATASRRGGASTVISGD